MRRSLPIAVLQLALVSLAACHDSTSAPSMLTSDVAASSVNAADDAWIVVLRDDDDNPGATARALARAHGAEPSRIYEHAIKGFAVTLPASAAAALARAPQVLRVEPDVEMSIVGTQAGATWGLDRIDQRARPMDGSYTANNEGASVTAYILDTGIRYDHVEFQTSLTDTQSRATYGLDVMSDSATYRGADCHGHGTHVAGTVGGLVYGVAKQVQLVAVRVLSCSGSGSTSGIIAAIDWMVQTHGAGVPAVANMSLGGSFSQALNDAVQRAINDGIVMAVAAGNSNVDACTASPASAPNAITLGASGMTDARASFSNFGDCVDFFAPGVSITSAGRSSSTATAVFSGTSMASPHAAGAAALYLEGFPGSTPAQVRDGLFAMATPAIVTSANSVNDRLLHTLPIPGNGSPPPPTNVAPTPAFTYSCVGLTCAFTDGSTDSDGTVLARAWTFGDESTSMSANPSRTYSAGGTYQVRLTATDDDGASASTTQSVTVTAPAAPPPPANIALAAATRSKGTFRVDLGWTGATAADLDVYRNGALVVTVANTGAYTDNVGKKRGTYSHKVCHAGTTTCSNTTTSTF